MFEPGVYGMFEFDDHFEPQHAIPHKIAMDLHQMKSSQEPTEPIAEVDVVMSNSRLQAVIAAISTRSK